jgi:hypothetical protein
VHVVPLERVVNQPEIATLANVGKAALELAHDPHSAKRRDVRSDTERDVSGMRCGDGRSSGMGHAGTLALRLPAGTRTTPTPATSRSQGKAELASGSGHHQHSTRIGGVLSSEVASTLLSSRVRANPARSRRQLVLRAGRKPPLPLPFSRGAMAHLVGPKGQHESLAGVLDLAA